MIKAILEAHGIRCVIRNEQSSLTVGAGVPSAMGPALNFSWPEVWVLNDGDFEEALQLLRTARDQ